MTDLKKRFLYEVKFAKKRGDLTELNPKALFDEIAKSWIVGVYYKQGGKLKSFILVEGKTEAEAKEVEEKIKKLK